MHKAETSFKDKVNWERTGKSIQEMSLNKGGVITLEEERDPKSKKTRLVQTGYTTIVKKPKED